MQDTKTRPYVVPTEGDEDSQMRSIIPTHQMDISLRTLYAERGRYNNLPAFQRGKIWRVPSQRYLIHSIFMGFPISPLLLNRRQRGNEVIYEVVDGQQRLTAILDYFDGKFTAITRASLSEFDPTPMKTPQAGRRYSDLAPVWKGAFDSYDLHCVVVDDASDETLGAIYRRLQEQEQLSHGETLWSYRGKGASLAHTLMGHPAWKTIYAGTTGRLELYEVSLEMIAMEELGIPVSLRLPLLKVVASSLSDDMIDAHMQERIIRRITGMAHIFQGVVCTSKNELIALYQAAIQLERDRVDLLHSVPGCGAAWYGSVRTPPQELALLYFWGLPHTISQFHNKAAQTKLWSIYLPSLLALEGLHRPTLYTYSSSRQDIQAQH